MDKLRKIREFSKPKKWLFHISIVAHLRDIY